MAAKGKMKPRALFGAPAPLSTRVKTLERKVRSQRPEMQTITFDAAGTIPAASLGVTQITDIAEGTGDDQRRGDEIRVHRVEVRGVADSDLDLYLIQQHGPTTPVIGNFTATNGAFLTDAVNNNTFTEWVHYRNIYSVGSEDPVKFSKRFNGMRVKYTGSTGASVVRNGLCFCVLNRGTVDSVANLSIRLWFTDP